MKQIITISDIKILPDRPKSKMHTTQGKVSASVRAVETVQSEEQLKEKKN
jgi:hypothetical protein